MRRPVPDSERNRKRLAMCISLTAGYLDGYGFLILGTYVSFMSGNTTMAGLRTGQANLSLVISPVIAVVCFLVGSFVGNFVAHSGRLAWPEICAAATRPNDCSTPRSSRCPNAWHADAKPTRRGAPWMRWWAAYACRRPVCL